MNHHNNTDTNTSATAPTPVATQIHLEVDDFVEAAVVDGAVVDGAVVDGAVVDGAVVDGAVVDGAVVDEAVVGAGFRPLSLATQPAAHSATVGEFGGQCGKITLQVAELPNIVMLL